MSNRQFALKSKIGELITLLETIQGKGIESVPVKIDTNETRIYTVGVLKDALNGLMAELISSPESIVRHWKKDTSTTEPTYSGWLERSRRSLLPQRPELSTAS